MVLIYLPGVLFIVPLLVVVGVLYTLRWQQNRKFTRSSLTAQLLRPPGDSVRNRIEDMNYQIATSLICLGALPLLLYTVSFLSSQAYLIGIRSGRAAFILYGLIGLGLVIYYTRKVLKLTTQRRSLRLGLDGELAVAEELNKLMLNGYHVYHNFPADKFNIHHVLVGSSGVYAVETEARPYQRNGRGVSVDTKVMYDGTVLQFPSGFETKSVEDAKSKASWLAAWLRSAVGEKVSVKPMVTLPGWSVKRTNPGGVSVLNPREIRAFMARHKKKVLPEEMVDRIAHQIEQQCRKVEPETSFS